MVMIYDIIHACPHCPTLDPSVSFVQLIDHTTPTRLVVIMSRRIQESGNDSMHACPIFGVFRKKYILD